MVVITTADRARTPVSIVQLKQAAVQDVPPSGLPELRVAQVAVRRLSSDELDAWCREQEASGIARVHAEPRSLDRAPRARLVRRGRKGRHCVRGGAEPTARKTPAPSSLDHQKRGPKPGQGKYTLLDAPLVEEMLRGLEKECFPNVAQAIESVISRAAGASDDAKRKRLRRRLDAARKREGA